jgi:hypothetical protein
MQEIGPSSGEQHHFGGTTTQFLIEFLRAEMSEAEIRSLLERVAETRTVEAFHDDSTWSSFSQLRLLLEGAPRSARVNHLRGRGLTRRAR